MKSQDTSSKITQKRGKLVQLGYNLNKHKWIKFPCLKIGIIRQDFQIKQNWLQGTSKTQP